MSFIQHWVIYDEFKFKLFQKLVDLDGGDTVKVALFTSSSNCADAALVSAVYATLTNELAAANGYSTGGAAAASPGISGSVGITNFDTDNVEILASGGSLVAKWAVIYDVTTGDLIAYGPLALDSDGQPVNITVLNGITLRINITNVIQLVG